jgi:indole-3-glycerol phosphate synthase
VTEGAASWPERRFSQVISEGDGISVIPSLRADLVANAAAAGAAGAEALAVSTLDDLRTVRPVTDLPVLVVGLPAEIEAIRRARMAGADAVVLTFEGLDSDEDLLLELAQVAAELGLDCALDVRDEDEVERVLDLLDPEILVLSERKPARDEVDLDRTLELLPDVPAGKLVVSESRVTTRDQLLELERAGVDAVLLAPDVPVATLAELTGRTS